MRRPAYSKKVVRGLNMVSAKMKNNFNHGFIPHWWTRSDRKDAERALEWMDSMIAWAKWRAETRKLEEEK